MAYPIVLFAKSDPLTCSSGELRSSCTQERSCFLMLFLLCYLLGNLRFLQAPVIQPSGWKTGATTHPALLYPHCGQGMGARCRGGGSRKEERVGAVTGAPPHALKLSFFMWRGDFLLSNLWAPAGSAFSHCNHCSRTTWELRH